MSSILTTLTISFARAAFNHIPRYKILSSAFPWKISCCYCCLPASVCFSREWNSFLIFFPTSSSSSLPAPRYQLSTLISTHYTSFISILLQNVRSHRRKNGEGKYFDIQFFKETKSSSQQLEGRNQTISRHFWFLSYEASQPSYIFIMTPDRSMMKSFKCKKANILLQRKYVL